MSGVDTANLSEINQEVDLQSLVTVDAIHARRKVSPQSALMQPTTPKPRPVCSITKPQVLLVWMQANLNEVNQQVDEQSLITVNAMQTLTDSLNTIRTYAADNTQTLRQA